MMEEQSPFPFFPHCTSRNLPYQRGNYIAIIGRVVYTSLSQGFLTLEVDPRHSTCLKVMVPSFTVNYLLEESDLRTLQDKQDILLAEKHINTSPETEQNADSQSNSRTSLMWLTVNQEEITLKKQANSAQPKQNTPISDYNSTSLTKEIKASTFLVGQFIEVRGMCIDEHTMEMMQFSDFGTSYDLKAHNDVLNKAYQFCPTVFF